MFFKGYKNHNFFKVTAKQEPIRLNLQFFNDAPPTDPPGDNNPGDNPPTDLPPVKTFTQEEVNGIASKEAKKAQEKLFRELGFEDVKGVKDGLAKLRDWQDSQKTDQQKLNDELLALKDTNGSLAEQKATLEAQLATMKLGVHEDYMDDVITLAKAKVNEDTDLSTAILQVVEKHPHVKGQAQEEEPAKPSFSTGHHQRQTPNVDSFVQALGLKN